MLQSITVSNIAVVSHLHVSLERGFSTFTGETGAGKSLLLDALNLVLGARAQTGLVRHETEEASVTAVFDISSLPEAQTFLEEAGFALEEETLIIRRHLSRDGKSRCFVNDRPSTAQFIKTLGNYLVEIHGQFDRLLTPAHHKEALDSFGKLEKEKTKVKQSYDLWKTCAEKLQNAKESSQKNQENQSYILFCLEELKTLAPQEGEEETLSEKRAFLMNYEKIKQALQTSLLELTDKAPVESALSTAYRLIDKAYADTPPPSSLLSKIDASLIALQETIEALNSALHDFEEEQEESLEDVEMRLHQLRAMAKKHHCLIADLPALSEKFQADYATIENADGIIAALEAEEASLKEKYKEAATVLSTQRSKVAIHLKKSIEKELAPLKLNAQFFITLTPLAEEQWSDQGMESVEFSVATNAGEAPGPLSKIASGGELSRLMLALKVATKSQKNVPTLIFDEIDSGLGGAVADAMGKRLKSLSDNTQILSITHSPQIAAYADQHYRVSKAEKEGRVQTSIDPLSTQSLREEEIARMLSGEIITPQATAAAAELLRKN